MLHVDIHKKPGKFELQIAFTLADCGIAIIFGPSGSGKTSLINCIAGLETPDAGQILCHGSTCFDAEQGINLPPEGRRLWAMFFRTPACFHTFQSARIYVSASGSMPPARAMKRPILVMLPTCWILPRCCTDARPIFPAVKSNALPLGGPCSAARVFFSWTNLFHRWT